MAHVLAPLVRAPQERFDLWNRRTGTRLAARLVPAFDSSARRRGLLGRSGLAEDEGLVLAPCTSIHTAFMRFPIDVLFLDRTGRVLKTAAGVPPWRIRLRWRAFAVVELAAGTLARTGTMTGDELELRTIA